MVSRYIALNATDCGCNNPSTGIGLFNETRLKIIEDHLLGFQSNCQIAIKCRNALGFCIILTRDWKQFTYWLWSRDVTLEESV